MKTRERILLTSLALFNQEGEPHVSTVDIANEMDISPGNLYYHFKGKEHIITALYDVFEQELIEILDAPMAESIDAEDAWFYLYVVFEQIHRYRYFYRNLNPLLQNYPALEKRFKTLLSKKIRTVNGVFDQLTDHGIMELKGDDRLYLSENIVLNLTFWPNYNQLRDHTLPEQLFIHRSVFQIVAMVAPYFADEYHVIYEQCCEIYHRLVTELSAEVQKM